MRCMYQEIYKDLIKTKCELGMVLWQTKWRHEASDNDANVHFVEDWGRACCRAAKWKGFKMG